MYVWPGLGTAHNSMLKSSSDLDNMYFTLQQAIHALGSITQENGLWRSYVYIL